MSGRARFMVLWTAATAPLSALAIVGLEEALAAGLRIGFGYWTGLLPYWTLVGGLLAWIQTWVLRKHRHPVSKWVLWVWSGCVAAAIVLVGIQGVWGEFLGWVGAVKLHPWVFWIYTGVLVVSTTLFLALGESFALWRAGCFRRHLIWISLKEALAIGLWAAFLLLELYCLPLLGHPWGPYRHRILVAVVGCTVSAGVTAWMLDRFYFRRGVAEPPARP